MEQKAVVICTLCTEFGFIFYESVFTDNLHWKMISFAKYFAQFVIYFHNKGSAIMTYLCVNSPKQTLEKVNSFVYSSDQIKSHWINVEKYWCSEPSEHSKLPFSS